MRFIMRSDAGGDAVASQNSRPTHRRSRRTDLPDTTTITTRRATDAELLHAKILDPDPNRSTHYLPPKLKGRILR